MRTICYALFINAGSQWYGHKPSICFYVCPQGLLLVSYRCKLCPGSKYKFINQASGSMLWLFLLCLLFHTLVSCSPLLMRTKGAWLGESFKSVFELALAGRSSAKQGLESLKQKGTTLDL